MAEKLLNDFLLFAFVLLPITWIVETVLSARWDKQYFGAGIPLFVFHIPVKNHHINIPSCLLLQNNFRSSGCIRNTSLLFKELDANMIGFRESLFQFGRWYSMMHGLLVFDVANSQVVVKGYLDWIVLCFGTLWVIAGPLFWFSGPSFIQSGEDLRLYGFLYYGMLFIYMGVFCSIDYVRFAIVAKFAAQAWTQQNVTHMGGV